MPQDPLHSVTVVATHPAREGVVLGGLVGAAVGAALLIGGLAVCLVPDPSPTYAQLALASCDVERIAPECRAALPAPLRDLPDLDEYVAWRVEIVRAIAASDEDLGVSIQDPVAHLVWEAGARVRSQPVVPAPLSSDPVVAAAERALIAEVSAIERETELAARREVLPVLWSVEARPSARAYLVAGSPWVHQELHAVGRIVRSVALLSLGVLLGLVGLWVAAWRRTAPVDLRVTPHQLVLGGRVVGFDELTGASWSDGLLVTLGSGEVWRRPGHRVAVEDLPLVEASVLAGLRTVSRSVDAPEHRAAVERLAGRRDRQAG